MAGIGEELQESKDSTIDTYSIVLQFEFGQTKLNLEFRTAPGWLLIDTSRSCCTVQYRMLQQGKIALTVACLYRNQEA